MPDLIPVDHDPFALPGGQLSVVPGTEGRPRLEVAPVVPYALPEGARAPGYDAPNVDTPVTPGEQVPDLRGLGRDVRVVGGPVDPVITPRAVRPPGYEALEPHVRAAVDETISEAAYPGRVARGQQPQVPGQWSDVDEAIHQFDQQQEIGWSARAAQNLAGGAAPAAGVGTAGIFGGRLAATADLKMLERAEQMAAAGVPRERIWSQTGWFQGADGKWRFEIPDENARTRLGFGAGGEQPLEHPELLAAYPRLKDATLSVEPHRVAGGSYLPAGEVLLPYIQVRGPSEGERTSSVLHELQHGVQDIEDFARGTNLQAAAQLLSPRQTTVAAKKIADKLGADWPSQSPEARNNLRDMVRFHTYQMSAGETEARNVQTRWEEGIHRTPPWRTEDIPAEKQIVNFSMPGGRSRLVQPDPPSLSDYFSEPTAYLNRFGMPIKGTSFSRAADEAWSKVDALPKGYGPLDLSLAGPVPGVPQVPLERYVPPRGVSPRLMAALSNPAVLDGVINAINRGIGMGAHLWYHTEPWRQAFVQELGDRWEAPFRLFMDLQAAASPRSDVPTQIRNGSWLYAHAVNGRDLPPGGPGNYPYGHLASANHRRNFATVTGPGWDVVRNPKPPSFSANLQGNLEPGTIDTHAFRLIGLLHAMSTGDPSFLATNIRELMSEKRHAALGADSLAARFGEYAGRKVDANGDVHHVYVYRPQQLHQSGRLSVDEAVRIPVFWASKPNKNEYGAAEQFYKRVGREHFGLPTGDAQSAAWSGGGEITGLGTDARLTFPELSNQRIMYTSYMRGEEPHKVLRSVVRGYKPLLGIAGAGMAFPHLWNLEDPNQ